MERYHRQSLIPNWNQEEISNAKVLILGIGATGSYLATNLALTGIGKIILVDFDTIERSNLNRQLLFNEDDIGKNKAEIATKKLKILNPLIEIIPFPKAMEKLTKDLLKDLSVIASCLDTFLGRRWANSLALREKVPIVTSGMYGFLGNVQTIIPYETACFECQPLIPQEKLAQVCTPLGKRRKKMKSKKEEPPMPSISTVSSIVSGIMSQEILKIILNIGKRIDNYLFYDGLNNNFTQLKLNKNPNCPICGENYKLQDAPVLIFKDEKIKTFRERIALAFGLKDPKLMFKGKILNDDLIPNIESNNRIFVMDDSLAAPIALKLIVQDENTLLKDN